MKSTDPDPPVASARPVDKDTVRLEVRVLPRRVRPAVDAPVCGRPGTTCGRSTAGRPPR